jgi:glutamate--cysteine ligase catalytic subunit
MGFLAFQEKPVTYKELQAIKRRIKKDGILQILALLKNHEKFNLKEEELKYGFEVEVHVMNKTQDPENSKKHVYSLETNTAHMKTDKDPVFKTVDEYGLWMLEAIPKSPYKSFINGCGVYRDLQKMYPTLDNIVGPNSQVLYAPVYPKLGTQQYKHQNLKIGEKFIEGVTNNSSNSNYQDDSNINEHYRFRTLTENVANRRGEKPDIRIPLYKDQLTNMVEVLKHEKRAGEIHLDAFSFGMGQNSLQITFGAEDMDQARWLYDQFHMLTSIMLALSATSSVFKGKLSDWDTRWKIIEMSTDCRNESERKDGAIAKGRYSTINQFISNDSRNKAKYNNEKPTINKGIKKFMKSEAKKMDSPIDKNLLNHFAYLWVRDPLVAFPSRLELDNNTDTDHFESIQSTNWNDVRFKPPPAHDSNNPESSTGKIGFRTEFRSMDSQLTAERSFLMVHSVQLFARMLADKTFRLNFYIPMTLANENFERAHKRDAARTQKFWFRKNVFDFGKSEGADDVLELSLSEIFHGTSEFLG